MSFRLDRRIFKSRLKFVSALTIYFLLFFLSGTAVGQEDVSAPQVLDCPVPQNTQALRPGLDGEEIKVHVGFFVVDVKEIRDVEQTYKADVFFNLTWNDPRLSEKVLGSSLEKCVVKFEDIWHPAIIDVNRNKGEKLLPMVVNIDSAGNVNYKQRYIGELSSDLDFTDFPFDKQVLHFILAAYGPDTEDIVFVQDKDMSGSRDHYSIEGWKIGLMDAQTTREAVKTEGSDELRSFARIDFRLSAERDRKYYLLNVITPLCLIVLMAWAVFWIDPKSVGPQVGLSTATVFTLIAYRFSLSYQLPKVSYFTRIDKFVLFSTILVFIALGTAIATSKIASDGNEELARAVEKWARYIYLFAFLLIIIFTLWL